jgi:hypothetical protein
MRGWAIGLCGAAMLAACGDSIHLPEVDAAIEDDLGLVTVTVRSDNISVRDLLVYFQSADSQVVLSTTTDGSGVANAFMRDGGFVTVIDVASGNPAIYTYAGVKPGDQLVLDLRTSRDGRRVKTEIAVPTDPGSRFYELVASCAFGGPVELFPAPPEHAFITLLGCKDRENILIRASDDLGTSRFLFAADVDLAGAGPLIIGGSYQAPRAATLSATHVPAAITDLFVTQQLAGIPLTTASQPSLAIVDGEAQIGIALPVADGAQLVTRLDAFDTGVGNQHIIQVGPNASTEVDLHGGLRAYTSRPQLDPTTSSIRWTEDTTGVVASYVVTRLNFFGPEGSWQWAVFGPRSEDPVVRLPVLPRKELTPTDAESVQIFTLISVASDGGYDRVRATGFGPWLRDDTWPTALVPGQVAFQTLGSLFVPD